MASDRKQYARAMAKWEALHAAQAYSIPERYGRVAILCSFSMETNEVEGMSDADCFVREAEEFGLFYQEMSREAVIIEDAQGADVEDVLTDPTYSTVIMIGHGALSYVYMPNGLRTLYSPDGDFADANDRLDWRDVSAMADHLKTGEFIQRHCGNYTRQLSVPLGTFAMASHLDVKAPVGSYFSPKGIVDNETRRHMQPVCAYSPMRYHDVKSMFDYAHFLQERSTNSSAESNQS